MTNTFSNKEVIKSAWNIFKTNWKFIIPLGAVTLLAQMFVTGMYQMTMRHSPLLGLVTWTASILVTIIISLGWSKVFLAYIRNGFVDWNTFKTDSKLWLHLIKTTIWYMIFSVWYTLYAAVPFAILALIGYLTHIEWLQMASFIATMIAFAVVAIYMGIRYQFISYAVLDFSELRSKAVFKKAGSITKDSFWKLIGFNFACALVVILGFICILFGLVIAIPVVKIAQAKVYDLLKSKQA